MEFVCSDFFSIDLQISQKIIPVLLRVAPSYERNVQITAQLDFNNIRRWVRLLY